MSMTVTTAPCCWGVDDIANPHLPDWRLVLDEVAAAGYGGLELGPYGYMPLDAPRVGAELQARGLYIVAGTIFDDLVDPANRAALLRQTREICALITALPRPPRAPGQRFNAPYLTVMDWGHDERDFAAGHADRAPRLDDAAWAGMVANIRAIATAARDEFGVRAVILRAPAGSQVWSAGHDINELPTGGHDPLGWDDPLRSQYPLQLFGFHYKARTHSSYGNVDVLQAACRQEVWINPLDAEKRGIKNGDMVRVFNQRGEVRLPAKVTPRIMPGVSAMGQGAWHDANMNGDRIDHGSCINTLTTHRPSPLAKGNPQHTNLVQIEKV